MKLNFKPIAAVCTLLFAFAASNARADSACSLSAVFNYPNSGPSVAVNEGFGFYITIDQQLFGGPGNPNQDYSGFSISFHGTKDGVPDTPPGDDPLPGIQGGESYPGTYPKGSYYLGGFGNPGGVAGTYTRYAKAYWPNNGGVYCTTDPVTIVLL